MLTMLRAQQQPELSYEDLLEAEDLRRSFRLFVPAAWSILEPGVSFVPGWHIDAISEHLQAVSDGQIKRLLVNMPPRHAKSSLISCMWPVWSWLRNASEQWLCASYVMDLAERDNRRSRNLINHPWFQARYGHLFKLRHDQNEKGNFENDHNGYRIATSVGGSGTGKGGNVLLIDDPHPARDGSLERRAVSREKALEWFKETWSSRLNDREHGAMVIVGQRIHKEDLSGHVLGQGGWEHLNLPSEYDTSRRCFTSIGWSDPRTEEGALLWPARFSQGSLEALKHEMGALVYACQFLQSPVPPGGHIFKQEHERLFQNEADTYLLETPDGMKSILKSDCWLFGTVDLAISSKQTADYTVVDIWACTPTRDLLLLHSIRGHWTHPEQQTKIKQLFYQFQPDYISVENVAYQLAIIQDLLADGVSCREYKPTRDKVSRASSASVWHANGKVYFLKIAPWLQELRAELYFFPNSSHDDQVDVISMAADIVRATGPQIYDLNGQTLEEKVAQEEAARKPIDPFEWDERHSYTSGGLYGIH